MRYILAAVYAALLLGFPTPAVVGALDQAMERKPKAGMQEVRITIGAKSIDAVIAETEAQKTEGLLGWTSINEEEGMLLDFIREGEYAIHMQRMRFPIDAVWIDANGIIKLIYKTIQPNSGVTYPSIFPARYCLEIKAGFCKKYGVAVGKRVRFGWTGDANSEKEK